jgi:mannosyltransferase
VTVADSQVARRTTVLKRGKSSSSARWKDALPATILTAVMAALVFYALGRRNLANDEATSFFIAQLDFSSFMKSLATSEANGGLFYAALRGWLAFGESEQVLRILPALFAIATVPVLYILCLRLLGRAEAFAACALLVTNAFFIAHGQDLRSYSLAALLATLSTLAFERLVRRGSAAAWAAYVFVAALAMYAHFFSAFVIAAHVASLAFLPKRTIAATRVFAAYACVVVLISPLIFFVAFNDVGQVDWIPDATWNRLQGALGDLAGMGGGLLLGAYGVFCAVGLGSMTYVVFKKRRSMQSWSLVLVACWLVFPIVGAFVLSQFKPLFVSRYLLVALPAVAVVAGVGVAQFRWKPLYAAALGVAVLLGADALADWYRGPAGEGWEGKAVHVLQGSRPGDGAVFYAPTIIRPFGYYSGYYTDAGLPRDPPEPIYPHGDWLGFSATRYSPSYSTLARAASRHERVWFVTGYARDEPRQEELAAMQEVLARTCETEVHSFFRGTVKLFSGCRRAP